jgi:dienelactone hydrolase
MVVGQLVLVPVLAGLVQTHKFREDVGEPPPGFEPVSFSSTDGLGLSGWYRPSENGAAVVIVNSAGGDRTGSRGHAKLLARNGYGVLTYDARGTGQSEGTPNGWGWEWEHDVEGAIDFLQTRPDVEDHRIGGLGLSTGADVLIEVAAKNPEMRAVVGDGATARSFADRPPGLLSIPFTLSMMGAGELFSGTSPGEPLTELIARAAPTPILLVAAGSLPLELYAGDRYAASGPSTTLWKLPQVRHTNAIREVRTQYERRVIGHFDAALLNRPQQ